MKLFTRMVGWGVLAAMAATTTALAQKEQWLDYHVNREGRGYHYLTLTTNPPPNLKLPKFNSAPYFALWKTPLDPAGRWLCLDRTKKSGLYDRVYIDTTGNGRLDDKTPVSAWRTDQVQRQLRAGARRLQGRGRADYLSLGGAVHAILRRRRELLCRVRRVLRGQGGYRRQEAADRGHRWECQRHVQRPGCGH